MTYPVFPLAPRYRLDDDSVWLEGIDPSRNYWIWVNGESTLSLALPGLLGSSLDAFKSMMRQFRALEPGESMPLLRAAEQVTLHCISPNCYAVEDTVNNALVWHLFDQETLDSLLMTGHPDWQCAPRDVDLGRRQLLRSWQQSTAA